MVTQYIDPVLSVAAIENRTNLAGAPITDLSGEELRLFSAMIGEGIITGWNLRMGTGMNLIVGSGTPFSDRVVVAGYEPRQGNYIVRLDDANVTIPLPGADQAATTIHGIYVVVRDNTYDPDVPGYSAPRLAIRTGTPGAGAPTVDPNWRAWYHLCDVNVPAGSAGSPSTTIADKRIPSTLATGSPPVGCMLPYAGSTTTIPDGWLLCNGQIVNVTDWPLLYDVLKLTYGPGNGTGQDFHLPDMRRRFASGKNSGDALGTTGGVWSHEHGINDATSNTSTAGSHDHEGTKTAGGHSHGQDNGTAGSGNLTASDANNHAHGGDTTQQAGPRATNDTTPGLYTKADLNAIATSGEFTNLERPFAIHSHTIPTQAAHGHNIPGHTHGIGSGGGHEHDMKGLGDHNHTLSNHNHGAHTDPTVSPYMLINYIIRGR